MIPAWIEKILESRGLEGAIIFVLLTGLIAALLYIRSMQAKADRSMGYRLAERDTLNKALTDAASVLADMLEATRDRNDLTAEQAELIAKQVHAFELLKATIVGQYDSIKEHNHNIAQVISAMAEAVRQLSAIVNDNKYTHGLMISEVKNHISEAEEITRREIRTQATAIIADIRMQLGNELTIVKRNKRTIAPTRPIG